MLNFCKRFITFSVCFFFAHAGFAAGVIECKINKAIVRSNQTVLQDLGVYNSNIDGLAGPNYRKAVDKAEKILGKRADGAKRCLNPAERQVLISVFDAKKRGSQCGKLYSPLEIETLFSTLKREKLTKRRLSDFESVGALIWSIDEVSRLETYLAKDKHYETQQNSARDCRLDKAEIENLLGTSFITETGGFENTEGQKLENSPPTVLNTSTQTELIVDHSKNYTFDPYECAFQLIISSGGRSQQTTFYYQPERNKYVAKISLSVSDFMKISPSELSFSSLESSYCSPKVGLDKAYNLLGANSIEFPDIPLITTKAIDIVVSNQEKPQTSSQTQKSSLFEILLPENNEDTSDQTSEQTFELLQQNKILEQLLENANDQISVLTETVQAFERDRSSLQRELDELASMNHSLNFERDELRASLATSLLNYTGSQTELKNALVEIDFLSAEVITLQNKIQKLIEIDTENMPNGNGSGIKEAFLKQEIRKLREALETEKARAAKEYALRLKLEQQLDN